MVPRVPRFPFYRPLPAGIPGGESGMDPRMRLLKVTRLFYPPPLPVNFLPSLSLFLSSKLARVNGSCLDSKGS